AVVSVGGRGLSDASLVDPARSGNAGASPFPRLLRGVPLRARLIFPARCNEAFPRMLRGVPLRARFAFPARCDEALSRLLRAVPLRARFFCDTTWRGYYLIGWRWRTLLRSRRTARGSTEPPRAKGRWTAITISLRASLSNPAR